MPQKGKARNIDEWAEMFSDTHQDLTERKARGEELNKMEKALLLDLDEQLAWVQARTYD